MLDRPGNRMLDRHAVFSDRTLHDFQSDLDAIAAIAAVPSILDVVRQTTGMGFVAVARVTEGRWVACKVLDTIEFGLETAGELAIETTICHEIRRSHRLVAIDNVDEDAVYFDHHTPLMYGFKSYVSVPIIVGDGSVWGTLCAIDPAPRQVKNSRVIGMFELFAELIAKQLDAAHALAATEVKLKSELETSELRDQFIAVMGHDLRGPLASVSAGARMLSRLHEDEQSRRVLSMMLRSVDRMANLIDNVMDFARGRLGGGLGLNRAYADLLPTLEQVVSEYRSTWPERTIEVAFDLPAKLYLDHGRIGQLFSNLLGNALTHGAPDGPIRISATADESGYFELSTANAGEQIPREDLDRLFQPFKRRRGVHTQGLGLGLYIAAQIAAAHEGRIGVVSSPQETRFTLVIPRA